MDYSEIQMKELWNKLQNIEKQKEQISLLNEEARVEKVLRNSFEKLEEFCSNIKFGFKNTEKIYFETIK